MKLRYFLIVILSILILYICYLFTTLFISFNTDYIVVSYQSLIAPMVEGYAAPSIKITISNQGKYSYIKDGTSNTNKDEVISEETLREIESICLEVVEDYEKENSTIQYEAKKSLSETCSLIYNRKKYTITYDIFLKICQLIF